MTLTADIWQAMRRPRALIRAKLAAPAHEGRALALVMGVSALVFVARWPGLARRAHLDLDLPFEALFGAALFVCLFILPLVLYALAALSHLIARLRGGAGSHYGARMALAWALMGCAPLMLLEGLLRGFLGDAPATGLIGLGLFVWFVYLWAVMLIESEKRP